MADIEKVINQLEADLQRAERTGEQLVHVGRKTAKEALEIVKQCNGFMKALEQQIAVNDYLNSEQQCHGWRKCCVERSKRLELIEKALEITLTERQRNVVLSLEYPDLSGWGRSSGKTTAAVVWTLLWREEPIYLSEEMKKVDNSHRMLTEKLESMFGKRAIPDPDGYVTYTRFRFLTQTIMAAKIQCIQHGIETCDIFDNK